MPYKFLCKERALMFCVQKDKSMCTHAHRQIQLHGRDTETNVHVR